jgi:uncharacterized protein YlxW (UPF0749 family)
MKKTVLPLFAAFLVTAVIGLGMFGIGGNAATNKNGAPVLDSPTASSSEPGTNQQQTNQATLEQLQNLVQQYQQREQQYQSELSMAQQQINQDETALQQYQQLMALLQSRGIIAIDGQGRIFVPNGRFDEGRFGDDD